MTKISQLSDIGASLAGGDEFVIRDVSDATTPNKKVTSSGIIDYVIGTGSVTGFTKISAGAGPLSEVACTFSGSTGTITMGTASAGSPVERLRIDSSGRVGIGASSPESLLDLRFATSPATDNGVGLNALRVFTSSALAANTGGAISLGGVSTSGGATAAWGQIAGRKENATSANYAGYLQFATNSGVGTMSERMRIDSSGNVGIGTSSPGYALDVASSVAQVGAFTDAFIQYKSTAGNWHVGASSSNAYTFYSGTYGTGTERLRIDSSGNVGIGTSSPGVKLAVFAGNNANVSQFDSTAANGGYVVFSTSNTARGYIGAGGNTFASAAIGDFGIRSDSNLLFASGGSTERLRIDSAGNVGIGTSSPSSLLHLAASSGTIQTQFNNGGTSSFIGHDSAYTGLDIAGGGGIKFRYFDGAVFAEAARFDTTGRLGIGTSSPGAALEVFRTSDTSVQLLRAGVNNVANTNLARVNLSATAAGGISFLSEGFGGATGADYLVFGTNNTECLRIDSNGLVTAGSGGVNGFQALLLNSGQIDTSGGLFTLKTANNNSGGYYQAFRNAANTIIGTISQNGTTAVAYNTSSDYRLKENVVPLTGAIDRLNDLQVHRFNFIADPDCTVDGFIAHEAADVVPECVTGEKDAIDDDGNPIYQGIDQSKLVPLLTAALQEAIARIETLEAAVAALQSA